MDKDNLKNFHKWKNYERILELHHIYVYPRIFEGTIDNWFNNHPKIIKINALAIQLSSTFIRSEIKAGRNVRPMLPEGVWNYLDEINFYK